VVLPVAAAMTVIQKKYFPCAVIDLIPVFLNKLFAKFIYAMDLACITCYAGIQRLLATKQN
jgi:hypothetical protein